MSLLDGPTQLRVDPDARVVTWRVATWHLALRGGLFVALGVVVPMVALDGREHPLTVPLLMVTLLTAGWFIAGLRPGGMIDDHGIRLDTGHRRPTRIAWADVEALAITETAADQARLVAQLRDGSQRTVRVGSVGDVTRTLEAATHLGLTPYHAAG